MKWMNVLAAVLLTTALCCTGEEITGKVVGITDGDTIKLLDASKVTHTVRLADIDAPEGRQPYGAKAKEALAGKVFGQEVRVLWTNRDRNQRIIGTVMHGATNINHALVAEGWAWQYPPYSTGGELAKLEAEARSGKRGLWAGDVPPVPPWEFRKTGAK